MDKHEYIEDWINWQPSYQPPKFRTHSKWRKKANDDRFGDYMPGVDDVRKINAHLKAGLEFDEILFRFGISSMTLKRIMRGIYEPSEDFKRVLPDSVAYQKIFMRLTQPDADDEFIMIDFDISKVTLQQIKDLTYIPTDIRGKKKCPSTKSRSAMLQKKAAQTDSSMTDSIDKTSCAP